MTNKEIIKKYLGVKYKHGGQSIVEGLDCWTFLKNIFKDEGYELFDPEVDYRNKDWYKNNDYYLENYHKQWKKVEKPKRLDVLLFKSGAFGTVRHAGLYLGKDKFIHAVDKTGVIISRLSDKKWQRSLQGAYRLKVLVK